MNGDLAKEYALRAFEIDAVHPLVQEVFKTVVHFDKDRTRLTRKINWQLANYSRLPAHLAKVIAQTFWAPPLFKT